MYYTYVLLSEKDYKFYIGFTNNLKTRISEHRQGNVKSTKGRLPVKLIFYECYLNKYDSLRREKYLKTDKGKTTLRSMLREYLLSLNK